MSNGNDGAAAAQLRIERLESAEAMQECVRLQRLVWGYADLDVVPVNELVAAARNGGIVLGAVAPEQARRLVGFCFGWTGFDVRARTYYHASRMLAVEPGWRGRGVGRQLKLRQRAEALASGLTSMRWTFDPLQLGNAWLNLHVLGARGVRYHRDYFGAATSSPLHAGGTDRLEVDWTLEGEKAPASGPRERLELPPDAAALARTDPEALRRWRARVRAGLEAALARGLEVVDVEQDRAARRAWYVLAPCHERR